MVTGSSPCTGQLSEGISHAFHANLASESATGTFVRAGDAEPEPIPYLDPARRRPAGSHRVPPRGLGGARGARRPDWGGAGLAGDTGDSRADQLPGRGA